MTYDELETKLLADFRKQFTEYHPGTSTPHGYIEAEWVVQADPEELQDWIRGALREVKQHLLPSEQLLRAIEVKKKQRVTLYAQNIRFIPR